jgi:hypothetical protein
MFKKFRALDKDGMAHVGHQLNDGDIYLNKHVPDPSSFSQSNIVLSKEDRDNVEFKSEA